MLKYWDVVGGFFHIAYNCGFQIRISQTFYKSTASIIVNTATIFKLKITQICVYKNTVTSVSITSISVWCALLLSALMQSTSEVSCTKAEPCQTMNFTLVLFHVLMVSEMNSLPYSTVH